MKANKSDIDKLAHAYKLIRESREETAYDDPRSPTEQICSSYYVKFLKMCENETFDDPERLADSFEALVRKVELDNVTCFGRFQPGNLPYQLTEEFLDKVNWIEIVKFLSKIIQQDRDEAAAQGKPYKLPSWVV